MTKQTIPWELENGFLLGGFPYHDGRIVEFAYRETDESNASVERTLLIGVLNTLDQIVSIRFERVKMLNIAQFWPSAIVYDIEVNREKNLPAEQNGEPGFWDILKPVVPNTDTDRRRAEIEQAQKAYEANFFIRLYSSYGASLALICETITVEI
ncbi:hypothetical protein DTW90_28820 [Neorhizobium sp. P12A]|uniref:hypothetical protein n=1 Tax=Neorhizobium sp. P12A TaxID=2268027 RepID=UPI0011EEEBFC|nr:hypothetical protein [Neorhizobium sp. P12A]KAA0690913.1 hypothetical protein DTW90_28820 [Neorhizobium sp. P12A]